MANIRDVAKRAQTSVATVSAVVNNSGYVSPALRARVLQAVEALDYRPSAIARSLSTRRAGTVGGKTCFSLRQEVGPLVPERCYHAGVPAGRGLIVAGPCA